MIVENPGLGEYNGLVSEHSRPEEPVPLIAMDRESPMVEVHDETAPSALVPDNAVGDANLVNNIQNDASDSEKTASLHDADEIVQEPEEEDGVESQHVVVHTGDLVQIAAREPSNIGDFEYAGAQHDSKARIREQGDEATNPEDNEDWFVPNASQKYYNQVSSSSDGEELPRWKRVKTEKLESRVAGSSSKVPLSRGVKAQPALLKKNVKAASSPDGRAKLSAQKQAVAAAVATLGQRAAGQQTRGSLQDEALKRKYEKQQKELAEKEKIVADLAGAVKSLRKQLRESRVDRRASLKDNGQPSNKLLKGAQPSSNSRLGDESDKNGLRRTGRARTPRSRYALTEGNAGVAKISSKETTRKRHPARMDVKHEYEDGETEGEEEWDASIREKSHRQRVDRSETNKRKRPSSVKLTPSWNKGRSKGTAMDKFIAKLKAEQVEMNSFVDSETSRLKLKAPHLVYAKMNQYCFWPAILVTSYTDVPRRSILAAHPSNGGPKQPTEAGDRYMLVYFLGHNSWSWIPYPSRIKFFELGLDNKVRTQGKWFDSESYRKGLALANEEMDLITAPPKSNGGEGVAGEEDSETDVEVLEKQKKAPTKKKQPKKPKRAPAKSKSPVRPIRGAVIDKAGRSKVRPSKEDIKPPRIEYAKGDRGPSQATSSEEDVKPGQRNPFLHLLKDSSSSSND